MNIPPLELLILVLMAYGFGLGTPLLIDWKKSHDWSEFPDLLARAWNFWF